MDNAGVTPSPTRAPMPDHYENFPVASWLCPREFRPPIAAIYGFARTADDIADEGDATASDRLQDLAEFRADLHAAAAGGRSSRWPSVFGPLATEILTWRLPVRLLEDLLDAFVQDVRMTAAGTPYADRDGLLDYCRLSANPVGRLLLHLYRIDDRASLARSDAVCTGLQLANFWQDLSVDLPRGRHYLADSDLQRHGIARGDLSHGDTAATRALVAELTDWARRHLQRGAPLATTIPGRAGWELRLVVQGGLRILDRIDALDHATLRHRPRLGAADLPPMVWGAVRMRPARDGTIRADT